MERIPNVIRGEVFVVGDNVDTDQIIPAEYLSYNPADAKERESFGRYAMSGLPNGHVPFVAEGDFTSRFAVIVAGKNFGCGSSREHAPLAIAVAGCRVVVAESYARIFYRNSINGGYLVPLEPQQRLCEILATGTEVEVNVAAGVLKDLSAGVQYALQPLGDAAEIVRAGGLFPYARRAGLLR